MKLSLILPYHGRERIRGGSFFLFRGKRGEEEEDILDLND